MLVRHRTALEHLSLPSTAATAKPSAVDIAVKIALDPAMGSALRGDAGEVATLVALVHAMASGDEAALSQFYDLSSSRVFGLVLKTLNDAAAAEEVTHDTYLQAWRSAPDYDSLRGTPMAWLLNMARSRGIDRRRRDRSRAERETTFDAVDLDQLAEDQGEEAQDFLSSRRVRGAVAQLPLVQQRALVLAYFGGLSHSEIAEELDLPLGTVKSQIRAGVTRLRSVLESV